MTGWGVDFIALDSSSWTREVGRGDSGTFGVAVQKFFNRSPITLKFGAPKLERESQERESESEGESESEQVVIFTLVSCCSTLVSCYSIFISFCYFYL